MTVTTFHKLRPRWTCPECGESARLRDSKRLPSGVDVFYLQCQEPACGWCGSCSAVTTEDIKKSNLPLLEQIKRRERNRMMRCGDRPQWICPACAGSCVVRTSERMLADYRQVYLRCRDPECGWRGLGDQIVEETISPSGIPNPKYKRQMAERLRGMYGKPTIDAFGYQEL